MTFVVPSQRRWQPPPDQSSYHWLTGWGGTRIGTRLASDSNSQAFAPPPWGCHSRTVPP